MGFYSILFSSPASEDRARTHPWMRFCARKTEDSGRGYVLRGNKMVRATQDEVAPDENAPALFEDIRMNQVIDEVLGRDGDRDLVDDFYAFCPDEHAVCYRHEVMRSLENPAVLDAFAEFCQSMERSSQLLDCGKKVHHAAQREKYIVDGAALYGKAIRRLLAEASGLVIPSEGLSGFLDALRMYSGEPGFMELEAHTERAKNALEPIHYRLRVCDGRVLLGFDPPYKDLVREIADDFGGFADSKANENTDASAIRLLRQLELCPLEVLVMDALMRRYAREFSALHEAAELAGAIPEPFIARFVRELRWYFRFLDFMKRMRTRGCSFAYPTISGDGGIQFDGAYDLALALKEGSVVPNDLSLTAEERGVIVTGANQAGKTTFLRSIGQIAVLTALGLPVPCVRACLPLYQSIFSHFSEAEDPSKDHGKLKEELLRLKPALLSANRDSLVLMNEPFSSTTAQDAMDMADRVLSMFVDAGARVLCVTHISGFASGKLVNMTAQIDPVNHQRLYRIVRAPAETHAYADEIARKYSLTYREIKERVQHGI